MNALLEYCVEIIRQEDKESNFAFSNRIRKHLNGMLESGHRIESVEIDFDESDNKFYAEIQFLEFGQLGGPK